MPGASTIDFPRTSFKSLGVLESSLGETLISPVSNDTCPRTSFKRPGLQRPNKRTLSRRIGRSYNVVPGLEPLLTYNPGICATKAALQNARTHEK